MPTNASCRGFHLTIFDQTHAEILAIITTLKTLDYWAMGDHIAPTTGNRHTHLYLRFHNSTTFSRIKKLFPTAHIEAAGGNSAQNVDYITNCGAHGDKDTYVAGTFEASAACPPDDKKRVMSSLDVLRALEAGESPSDIIYKSPWLVKIRGKRDIEDLREGMADDSYGAAPREDLTVTYVQGSTRVGKTYTILQDHGFRDTCRVIMSEKNPFDIYHGQETIIFDEFRESVRLEKMLVYLDRLPCKLPARYYDRTAAYTHAYVVSNWPFEYQYAQALKSGCITQEDYDAWVARFHRVRVYTAYRTYDEYTVEDYFQHLAGHPVTPLVSVSPPVEKPPAVIILPAPTPVLALPPHIDTTTHDRTHAERP